MKQRKPLARSMVPIPKKSAHIRRKPFPDAKDKREPVVIRVMEDGRERINMLTKTGRDIYKERKFIAWAAQDGLCAICGKPVSWEECEADHIRPRSVGHDDRQVNIQAVHHECNFRKGSQQNYSPKGRGE
jgi:5-methylcytosine-specific restriction endonuclease McrA